MLLQRLATGATGEIQARAARHSYAHAQYTLHIMVWSLALHPVPAYEFRRGFCTLVLFINRSFPCSNEHIGTWISSAMSCQISACLCINSLQLLALDYLIAVYPMIVTVVAFFILQLHYHGFGPVLLICRPFQRMFARFRQGWNLHTSLIDAFITFLYLIHNKDSSCVN